jgi:hypothetical protein
MWVLAGPEYFSERWPKAERCEIRQPGAKYCCNVRRGKTGIHLAERENGLRQRRRPNLAMPKLPMVARVARRAMFRLRCATGRAECNPDLLSIAFI